MSEKRRRLGVWMVFRWPALIGVASAIGLVAALVGDGGYDLLSWALLGATLVVMAAAWRRGLRRREGDHQRQAVRADATRSSAGT
jgi:hypothetical protein